ncbi:MAG: hypothetical protein U0S49_08115 [Rhodospirillales bacterium]|nr:hypothetical protein [Rhodospirillales bacterium]
MAGHVFQMLPPPDGAVQDYLVRVFLLSYPEGVPYDVLLGIGYLFCISPLILYLLQRKALSLVVSLLAFSAVTAVGYRVGQNAWIVLCGLWGMALAHVSMEMFGVKQRSMMLQLPWQYSFGVFLIAALAYGALGAPKSNVIVYVSYLVFVMTMIYHIFSRILCNQVDSAIVKIVCKAGSMSLFCYVVHVPACIILEKYIEWSGGVASFIIGSSLILSLTTILMLLVDAAGHCAAIHVAPADFSAATPGTRPRLLREPVKFR